MYRRDPEWSKDTFTQVAQVLNIKPLQAYKWGYHKKQKIEEEVSLPL